MDTLELISRFYENYDEEGRLLSRHGSVEFLTTMRYIQRYLKPGMRILEIGAATGRYSHTLARMGYSVDAVELVQHNVDIFHSLTQPGEDITIRQGDARDLSAFPDAGYDMVLLLGPMYHLFTEADQLQALSEALRVTKPGGLLFSAYCGNDATMVCYCFGQEMLKDEHYQRLVDPVTFKAIADPAETFVLYRRSDVEALMARFPVTRLHFVGSDMFTNYMRPVVDAMDDGFFDLYLRYHFATCEQADLVGASHHFLDICRKDR